MRARITATTVGITLMVMAMSLFIVGGMTGCKKTKEGKPSVIDVEKIIDFTGSIKITLPDGTVNTIKVGETLPRLPDKTLIEVLSNECTGILSGTTIILKKGQIARIIRPGITAQKVIKFTGKLKITLPNGTVIFVEAGQPLPTLSDGTIIEVISGDLIVLVHDEEILVTPGQIVWLEIWIEEEISDIQGGDIKPASPSSP